MRAAPKLVVAVAAVGACAVLFGLTRALEGGDSASTATRPLPAVPAGMPAALAGSGLSPTGGVEGVGRATVRFRGPGEFGTGTPERALASFMEAWRDRHWSRMATWTAAEWVTAAQRPARRLARRFGGRRPLGYAVLSRLRRPGVTHYRLLTEHRGLRPRVLRETIAMRLVHGQEPRRGTAPGLRWGVDPASVRVITRHSGA